MRSGVSIGTRWNGEYSLANVHEEYATPRSAHSTRVGPPPLVGFFSPNDTHIPESHWLPDSLLPSFLCHAGQLSITRISSVVVVMGLTMKPARIHVGKHRGTCKVACAHGAPHGAHAHAQSSQSPKTFPASVPPTSNSYHTRRSLTLHTATAATLTMMMNLLPSATMPAHAYGGRGVITALDEGSGNVFYDDLLARAKENGSGVPKVGNSSPTTEGTSRRADGSIIETKTPTSGNSKRCGPECQRLRAKK